MFVELEAQGILEPVKQRDICLSFKNMNLGAFTEFPYEKRFDFDGKSNHCVYNVSREEVDCVLKPIYGSPFYNGKIPKVPFTQPRNVHCPPIMEIKEMRRLIMEASVGSCLSSNNLLKLKLALALAYNEERLKNFQLKLSAEEIVDKVCLREVENSKSEEILTGCKKLPDNLTCERKKSWADMVEEEEQASKSWKIDFPEKVSGNHFPESLSSYQTPGKMSVVSVNKELYNDENVNSNLFHKLPSPRKELFLDVEILHNLRNY